MTAVVTAAPPRPASPFKGLTPYTEADAAFFFGRDEEIEVVIANLEARRLTLLYGESGVGKSSLLRAGVIHRLRESARRNLEDIDTPEFIPVYFADWRDDPLAALLKEIRRCVSDILGKPAHPVPESGRLDEALKLWSSQADAEILIVLDQFEESFFYHPLDQGVGTFAGELPHVVNSTGLRARFLLAIREDALAKLDRFKREIPALFGTYLRLRHLDRDAAGEAITRPIEEYNKLATTGDAQFEIEPALVEAVLDQVTAGHVTLARSTQGLVRDDGAPAGPERIETPYLQLVMTRLWMEETSRDSRRLRLSTLVELGGAQTIVRTHLDDALGALTAEQQDLIADLFNHLVTPSGTKIAHTPADLAVWSGRPLDEIKAVLELLSSGQTRILRPVSGGNGPVRYEIYHDVLAAAVLDWRARHLMERQRAAAEEQANAEREQLEREREEAEAQARHERRRARMFRALAVVATALMAISGALAVLVWQQSEREANINASREIAASASDLLDTRLDLAVPLALDAYGRAQTLEARSALVAAVARAARLVRTTRPYGSGVITGAAFDPAGSRLASAGSEGLAVWDLEGRSVARPSTIPVDSLAFSPRASLLATSGDDGLTLWNTATWKPRWQIDAASNATSIDFSADGASLAALKREGISLWQLDNGRLQSVTWEVGRDSSVNNLAFSPTNPTLLAVVAGNRRRLRLWDVRASRAIASGPANIDALAFSPNGRLIALAAGERIRLWSTATHATIGDALRVDSGAVVYLAFSPDGTTLASGLVDGSVILWDVSRRQASQRIGATLRLRAEAISALSFAENTLAVTSAVGTVTLWDTRRRTPLSIIQSRMLPPQSVLSPGGGLLASFDGHTTTIRDVEASGSSVIGTTGVPVAFTPDGSQLLMLDSTPSGVSYKLWDVAGRRAVDLSTDVPDTLEVALSRDGTLVTASDSITVWADAPKQPTSAKVEATVTALAATPDLTRVAWGYPDGRVSLWQPLEREVPTTVEAHKYPILGLAFSPNGRLLAVASQDATVTLWDVNKAEPTGTLVGHSQPVNAIAFSEDGKILASGSYDSTVRLWDVGTRRSLGAALPTHAPVSDLAFGPYGLTALTSNGTLAAWEKSYWSVELAALRERLCQVIGQVARSDWEKALGEKSPHEPCAPGDAKVAA